jgi:hypothetical protein
MLHAGAQAVRTGHEVASDLHVMVDAGLDAEHKDILQSVSATG